MREVITVDGLTFPGLFNGFDEDLQVHLPAADPIRLAPWRYGAHLAALRDCTAAVSGELRLDAPCLCERVLSASGVPTRLHVTLAPLALWWAAGGDADEHGTSLIGPGWTDLGAMQARLHPWSEREQLGALLAARVEDADGALRFDAVGYLNAMVEASVIALDPPGAITELDAQTTARLLAAVVAMNVPDAAAEPALQANMAGAARQTIRLCAVLGWTPSQVWSAPAAEIERLLALLAATERPALPATGRSRLADLPDAVVLEFGGDP